VQPLSVPDTYRFDARLSDPEPAFEQAQLVLSSPEAPSGVSWRVVGTSSWKNLGSAITYPWSHGLQIELRGASAEWVQSDPDLLLSINGHLQIPLRSDADCLDCLVSSAPTGYLVGGHRWVPASGILPSFDGFESKTRSVLINSEDASYLVGGSVDEGYWSHRVGLGLPWRPLESVGPVAQSQEHQFHRVPGQLSGDLLLGVRGADAGITGFLVSNQDAKLYQVDPATGKIICGEVTKAGGAVQAVVAHPAQSWLTVGSKWGSLMAREHSAESGCIVEWNHAGLEVGSRLNLDVPPLGRGWTKGPVIVKLELVVGLDGGEEVSLFFLDGVFRSPSTVPREVVIYRTHLHYWWWENDVYGQIEAR
jgi:hypothetical protein